MPDGFSMANITTLLGELRAGNSEARSALFTQVYAELMQLAHRRLAGGRQTHLDAPSLVHEAYLRLTDNRIESMRDRRDFFGYSSAIMHSVIIDFVRHRKAQKRGAEVTHVTLSKADSNEVSLEPDFEALHLALEQLEGIDERAFRIVEMRYFAGLTIEEIAQVLDVSEQTVKRSWKTARAFLSRTLLP
jgi:RNA polymerase sigma factor (TIGR02999 family)